MTTQLKKTSGRYRLVCLSGNKKIATINYDSLTGKILPPSSKKVIGTDLELLDIYIFENFRSKEELYAYLKALGYPVSLTDTVCITYQHNKTTKYLELVYQNEELHDLAILCRQYKKKFSNYGVQNSISSKKLRKLVSSQISSEDLWKGFYHSLISYIHDPDFYYYLAETNLLGERAMGFIDDYLNNESCIDYKQEEAFRSAQYYIVDTFTAYKPIRGIIVARSNYFSSIFKGNKNRNMSSREVRENRFGYINPFHLISQIQLEYLEDHPYFDNLSDAEKEDFILSILGWTTVPWYERTIRPMDPGQIEALEVQPEFSKLTYLEKIRYANKSLTNKCNSEEDQPPYQKKKV